MLKIQKYLKNHSLEQLNTAYGVKNTVHPVDGRIILNYHQTESPKTEPIAKEARGLVLDKNFQLIACSFPRFFNWGEDLESAKAFDWSNFIVQEKVDGSLILLYYWEGAWRVNTRNSFGEGIINKDFPNITWSSLVKSLINEAALDKNTTYILELTSPYNTVVRHFNTSKLHLITAFEGDMEVDYITCQLISERLRFFHRPVTFEFTTLDDTLNYILKLEVEGKDDEGVVIRDINNNRWKIKNKKYLLLHHLKDNGNINRTENLLKIVMMGEVDEIVSKFPETKERLHKLQSWYFKEKSGVRAAWEQFKSAATDKDFALSIKQATPYTSILFEMRKRLKKNPDKEPKVDEVIVEFKEVFLKDKVIQRINQWYENN